MTEQQMKQLLEREPTPLYVFDTKKVRERVAYLRQHLPEKVELCYAIKANTFILPEISRLVDWLEICSPGEYHICKKAGIPSKQYVVSGVNKEPELMKQLVREEEIGCFTVESLHQFALLRDAAHHSEKRISLLLRLTSGNQFGLDKADLFDLVKTYQEDPYLHIEGIQFFSGTQKTSLKKLKRELDSLDRTIAELKETLSFSVEKLEFGPGFPVAYFEGDDFDEESFLKECSALLNNMNFQGNITLELGRSMAADCGTYLTRVVDTKTNCSEHYAIVDGGMHQLVYFGQSMAMKHPKIRLITDRAAEEKTDWNICGSLCTTSDFLVKRFPLPELDVGDVLAFEKTGAYCATEGISLFLSRELPAIVLLEEDGTFKTLREPLETEQFNAPQNR